MMILLYFLLIPVMETIAYDYNTKSDPSTADIYLMENQPWDGKTYMFGYLTTHGVMRVERGFLKTTRNGNQILVKVGAFTRFLNDDEGYIVKYYADENGFSEKIVDKLKNTEIYSLRSFADELAFSFGWNPVAFGDSDGIYISGNIDGPVGPGRPGQSGGPSSSSGHGQPGQSSLSGGPGYPGRPGEPGRPSQPSQSGYPSGSGFSSGPSYTGISGTPSHPGTSSGPSGPGGPGGPGSPTSDPRNRIVDLMLNRMIDIISPRENDIASRFEGR